MNFNSDKEHTIDYDAIIKEYSSLAYSICHQYKNAGLPLEDLQQEALLGLLDAAKGYNPTKGSKFSTYAIWHIKKRILAALTDEKKQSLQATSIDDIEIIDKNGTSDYRTDSWKNNLPSDMPTQEKRVIYLSYIEQLTLKDISMEMGVSIERVKQLRSKALRRIRSAQNLPSSE
jgi:RNA polymerase sigma factor (sigma-70 family)